MSEDQGGAWREEPNAGAAAPMEPDLSVGAVFGGGWRLLKDQLGAMAAMFVFVIVTSGALGAFAEFGGLGDVGGQAFQQLASLLLVPAYAGLSLFFVRFMRGDPRPMTALAASAYNRLFALIAVDVLYLLAVVAGLVALIVPGVIIALGLQFALLICLDYGIGPMESLKASWELMRGRKAGFFLFALAAVGLNLAGLLALVVGLVVTVPWTFAALMYYYHVASWSRFGPSTVEPGRLAEGRYV